MQRDCEGERRGWTPSDGRTGRDQSVGCDAHQLKSDDCAHSEDSARLAVLLLLLLFPFTEVGWVVTQQGCGDGQCRRR